jgi:CHAT domain-containing protein/Flp pilus assembly protein TadD
MGCDTVARLSPKSIRTAHGNDAPRGNVLEGVPVAFGASRASAAAGALLLFLTLLLAAGPRVEAASADQAADLSRKAEQSYRQGYYAESARLARQLLNVREKALGPESPESQQALLTLARATRAAGDYAKALPLAQRAVDLSDKTAGPESLSTAEALRNLAETYRSLGRYEAGLPLAERSREMSERLSGTRSAETAAALHTLAELYGGSGAYAKALPLAERALSIRQKTLGAEDPDTAQSLNDLGVLNMNMRDYENARRRFQAALTVREKVLGPDHPLTAESLANLAALEVIRKNYASAKQLFERALAVKDKMLGPEHPETANTLTNLAELYRATGDYTKAAPLLQRVLAIKEKALGPEHPETARSLNNLAGFYWSAGDYAKARALLKRAEAIWERALGPEHPDTARALNLLATLDRSSGNYDEALSLYRRGLSAEDRTLTAVFSVVSEDEKLRYLERTQGHYFAALSLVQQHFPNDPEAVRFGLDLVLRHKGIVLDAQARTRDALAGHLAGETLRSWQRLTTYRSDLAKALLDTPGQQNSQQYRQKIESLQQRIAKEEASLRERSGLAARELKQRQVTAQAVARRLSRGATLVEFVEIHDWDEIRLQWSAAARYLAFVLTADDRVKLVDLGGADVIDTKVESTLGAIVDPSFLQDLSAYEAKTSRALSDLYRRILAPLGTAATSDGPLIVSPDGELNKAPFAALMAPDGHYVVERRVVSYVASGRDLTREKSDTPPTLNLLLAANPAFDDRNVFRAGSFRSQPAVRAPDYKKTAYPPLPGTAEEAHAIPPLVKGTKKVLVDAAATESAVKSTRSPQILHLATHGFFLGDQAGSESSLDPLGRGGSALFRVGPEGPLARSGLALAGANYADDVTRGDDGILTALEVTNMDLRGTDLVVLSACETALGQIRTGEGVYGLRRAFVLAGARNLVMSLWPVSDKITRDLMERFYRAYEDGASAADALRTAELDTVAHLRKVTSTGTPERTFAPVNLWAPFIVQETRMPHRSFGAFPAR